MKVDEVEIIKKDMIDIHKNHVKSRRVNYDPKCIYITALNKKNANKKALKIIMKMVDEQDKKKV